jgi:cytochrome d ubiquinol oxidase subunit II
MEVVDNVAGPLLAHEVLTAGALTVACSFIGAGWVIFKADGALRVKAVHWVKGGIWGVVLGMGAVCAATPPISPRIFDKRFIFPEVVALAPLSLMSALLMALLWPSLRRLPRRDDSFAGFPFVGA